MEKSSFFDAEIVNGEYDRVYLSEDYAKYFSSFIGNGIFPNPSNNLKVTAEGGNMKAIVKVGKAWINGYYYENDSDLTLVIDNADGVLNRIDRIVLRLDLVEREISLKVKKGKYSSNAIPQEIERNVDVYELAIADIKINNGALSINNSDITDLRLNTELCGIVHGTVDQVDTTEIFNTYEQYLNEKLNGDEFNDWFMSLKNKLDPYEDIALQLQLQITKLEEKMNDSLKTDGTLQENLNADMLDGKHANEFIQKGQSQANLKSIELSDTKPYIDFHFNNSANDFTSRIIEETSGTLTVSNNLKVSGKINDKQISGTLVTNEKTNLITAINEVFTNASNGKATIANAITGIGGNANSSMTFSQLANAITTYGGKGLIRSNTIYSSVSKGVGIDENGNVYILAKISSSSNFCLYKYNSNLQLVSSLELGSTSSGIISSDSYVRYDRFIKRVYVFLTGAATGTGWYDVNLNFTGAVYGSERSLLNNNNVVNELDELTGDIYKATKSGTSIILKKINTSGAVVYSTTITSVFSSSSSSKMTSLAISKNMIFVPDQYSNGSYVTICNKLDGSKSTRVKTSSGFLGGFAGRGTQNFVVVSTRYASSSTSGNQRWYEDGTYKGNSIYIYHSTFGTDGTIYASVYNNSQSETFGVLPFTTEVSLSNANTYPILITCEEGKTTHGASINVNKEFAFITPQNTVAKIKF